ncbi:MAG: AAA family ATPase [Pseudomonadales bacterium]|nr:AAA family ATPase [Pseudomonadales bacterium]
MQQKIQQALHQISQVVLGKEDKIKQALCCMFSNGHLLIEDLPGMGKTTLAHALSRVFGLSYQRIQFTSDLLPADVLGVSVYSQKSERFEFHQGPIFSQLLLADEINRSTPKTQSALLEAMEEGQVTVDGSTRQLPAPFFVIATQNPSTQTGTFPLPESQLDRFLMCIELGYPDPRFERVLLKQGDARALIDNLSVCISPSELQDMQEQIKLVQTSDKLLDYIQRLIAFSRAPQRFNYGLSPRGALGLIACAKTWAFMDSRSYVVPEDVQAVLPSVVKHRLQSGINASEAGAAQSLLAEVAVV